ncbi:AP2 domain-containing protein [Pediococcus ethanolidurans]|uniref:AP2 domain-containing protein n=1 Tax=Pediococcus ethanolidurans TaxID=319653 RepID=UPI001C1EE022|nr:AP2 domain-containing protein [Pediococcus ethanolidurans]MBU7554462.1 hypothetical protein [Pediococcus ethanolidurans]
MRGVSKVKNRELWEVNYVNKSKCGRLRKFVSTEREANKLRKKWEQEYGQPKLGPNKGAILKDYRGKRIKNFLIIDYLPNSNKKVLVKNTITNEFKEMDLHGIAHGSSTGIPLKIADFNSKKGKNLGVRYRKDTHKWEAHISVHNKYKSLGSFLTQAEAIAARKVAEQKYFNLKNGGI